MPERINAAHRPEQALREAHALPNNVSTVEAWTQVFGLSGSDAWTTAVEVARLVGLLRDQRDEVYRKMGDTAVRPERYEGALNNVSNALDVQNLSASWDTFNRYLEPEVLAAVGWCADTLPAEEDAIDAEELTGFEEEVQQFKVKIIESDLPEYVKDFVLQQVGLIEQALREYPITGAMAFKRGYVNSFVNLTENQDTFLERQDEDEMQELKGFWRRLQEYAQTAGPWIAIGQAAVKVIELTSGN